ncbi:MAG: mannose-1-phosphate guanylyltransferase [Armatimonadetes bacterium]|nr:mannose-1-phosphate guanylyltransferase [Armatimonadota bacterium]
MFIVVMAGGSGTRFWPESRKTRPKQFIPIISERTMIQETLERTANLADPARHVIVIHESHRPFLNQLPETSKMLILEEPLGRNTAPCIGLAAVHLVSRNPDEPMVVLPADHFIGNVAEFGKVLTGAAALAEKGHLVTVGIPPTSPETGYGYIQKGEPLTGEGGGEVFKVRRFVEKPNREKALEYLRSGEYLWNAGIFSFTPKVILEEIRNLLPDLHASLSAVADAVHSSRYPAILAEEYRKVKSLSIDYGVMEKTQRSLVTVPGHFGWSDVGSWKALYELRESEHCAEGNLAEGETLVVDTRGSCILSRGKRLVAVLGMESLLVVDTEDAVLVANLEQSQNLRKLVEELEKKNNRCL